MDLALSYWVGVVAAATVIPAAITALAVALMGRDVGRASTRSFVALIGALASIALGGLAATVGWWTRTAAVEVFEQGFVQDCVADFDVGSAELKRTTCACALEQLYGDDDHGSTVSRMQRAADDPASAAAFRDETMRAMAPCAAEITDIGWKRGCVEGCLGGLDATRDACRASCDCSLEVIRRELPGDQGTLWLLQVLIDRQPSDESTSLMEIVDAQCAVRTVKAVPLPPEEAAL